MNSLLPFDQLTLIKMLLTLLLGGQTPTLNDQQSWIAAPVSTPALAEIQVDLPRVQKLALTSFVSEHVALTSVICRHIARASLVYRSFALNSLTNSHAALTG